MYINFFCFLHTFNTNFKIYEANCNLINYIIIVKSIYIYIYMQLNMMVYSLIVLESE